MLIPPTWRSTDRLVRTIYLPQRPPTSRLAITDIISQESKVIRQSKGDQHIHL